MRERLNVRPALALLTVLLVTSAGVALLHRWQVRRHAAGLLQLADRAEAVGRPQRAISLLGTYLEAVPGDSSARARYGIAVEALARDPKTRMAAVDAFEQVLAVAPDRADIRLRLVRLYVGGRKYPEAEKHLNALGAADTTTDSDVAALWGACQEVSNPAGAVGAYRAAIKLDPARVERYLRLVPLLRRTGDPKGAAEADEFVEKMVRANAGDAVAFVARARYRLEYKTADLAPAFDSARAAVLAAAIAADLATAVALDPKNVEARLTAAKVGPVDAARGHLAAALRDHPGDERVYLALAAAERRAGNWAAAAAVLRQGATRLPGNERLLLARTELALDMGVLGEADTALKELDRWKRAAARAVLLRARLRMAEGDWATARAVLETGRSTLAVEAAGLTADADVLLGRCFANLGEPDRAYSKFREALSADPKRAAAHVEIARALLAMGRVREAVDHFRPLAASATGGADVRLMYARLRVLEYLSTPRPNRRPEDLPPVFAAAAEKAPDAPELVLLRSEVMAVEEPDKVEAFLRDALAAAKTGATDIGLQLVRVLVRKGYADKAWAALDDLQRKSGPTADLAIALARLELVPTADDPRREDVVGRVRKLLADTPREADKVRLLGGLADAHSRWDDLGEARNCLAEIARMRPADVAVRLQLLTLAVRSNDRPRMEEAVRDIRRAEGKGGPVGPYAEAVLRLARREDRTAEGFREAERYLSEAENVRPNWSALATTRGELYELEGKPDEAVAAYARAVRLGDRRPVVLRKAVELLFARRRYAEADDFLQMLRPEDEAADVQRLAANVSLFNEHPERAVQLAALVVKANPEEYREYLWQAEILASARRPEADVVSAFRQAVDRAGGNGAPWVALVRYYVLTGHKDKAEEAFADMRRRLAGPDLPPTVARCHELLGQTVRAAEVYAEAVKSRPTDMEALGQLFAFHSRNGGPGPAVPALRQALEAKPPLAEADRVWVRRALAIALSRTDDYADYGEALRLVDRNLADAGDADELLAKARILATRLYSRREALDALKQIRPGHSFGPADQFLLGQLYADTGAWADGRRVLADLLKQQDTPASLRFFVDRLIQNGLMSEAEVWLTRLEEVAPGDPAAVRLRGLLLVKLGSYEEASAHLRSAARPTAGLKGGAAGADADRDRTRAVARVADELGRASADGGEPLFKVAEELFQAAANGGAAADELALVGFLGRRGKVEDARKFARAAERRAGAGPAAGALVVGAMYGTPPLSDAQLDALETDARAYLERAKASPTTAGHAALLHARRGRYSEAAQILRSVVDPRVAGHEALSNLAYMLVLAKAPADEVGRLLDQGVERFGPTASLLDTRGMVHFEAGRFGPAIQDFERAIEQTPSAAKCAHLAAAYLRAKRPTDAKALLTRADALRSDGTLVLPAEQRLHDELTRELRAK
jgi:tetratricopeptide (TPR) repeat protein